MTTLRVWATRCARAMACSSVEGFYWGSSRSTTDAAWMLSPTPPAWICARRSACPSCCAKESHSSSRFSEATEPVIFPWYHRQRTLNKQFHAIQDAGEIQGDHYGFHDLRRGFATLNEGQLSATELRAPTPSLPPYLSTNQPWIL